MSSESKASAYIVGSLPFIVFGMIWWINPHISAGSSPTTPDRGRPGRPVLDGHRRLHHGQDGQFRDLSGERQHHANTPPGPTLLGFDVIWVGTILAGGLAAMLACCSRSIPRHRSAIPMAKRVKALNERREQLKAGITPSRASVAPAGSQE
jgi:hypothetical protein